MCRRERNAHLRLGRERVDAPLALAKKIEQLDPVRAREGLAYPRELAIQGVLGGPIIRHGHILTTV